MGSKKDEKKARAERARALLAELGGDQETPAPIRSNADAPTRKAGVARRPASETTSAPEPEWEPTPVIGFPEGTPTLAERHRPKNHEPGSLKCGDIVFYRGERMFIEAAPDDWTYSAWVRITDVRIDPRIPPYKWTTKRVAFNVHADMLTLAPPAPLYSDRLPTVASVARKERAKTGERDIGDEIAQMLRPAESLEQVYQIASKYLGVPEADLRLKYGHLNPGQQRMNLGNKMRFKWRKGNK